MRANIKSHCLYYILGKCKDMWFILCTSPLSCEMHTCSMS